MARKYIRGEYIDKEYFLSVCLDYKVSTLVWISNLVFLKNHIFPIYVEFNSVGSCTHP